jgi:hypothetical protein
LACPQQTCSPRGVFDVGNRGGAAVRGSRRNPSASIFAGECRGAGYPEPRNSKPTYILCIFAQVFLTHHGCHSLNLSSMDETARKAARNQYVVMDDKFGAKLASMVASMDGATDKKSG